MLARLPSHTIASAENAGTRPLLALTTRALDDPSIALLDAWATTADVLTFYQERIANEGFLGTATERRSVLELARAIGYELSPGVAASTYLSFTVEEPVVIPATAVPPEKRGFQGAPGTTAPDTALLPAGTQVKSVPGPGEQSQTFETSEAFEARLEWNALRPRLTQPQPLDASAKSVWVEGIVNDVKAGGRLLFLTEDSQGDIVATPKVVVAVTAEDALGRTRFDLADSTTVPGYFALLKSQLTFTLPSLAPASFNLTGVQGNIIGQTWKEKDLSAFMAIQKWNAAPLSLHLNVLHFRKLVPPPPSFDLEPPAPGLFAFTVKSAAFGSNAPRWAALPQEQRNKDRNAAAPYTNDWDTHRPSIAQDSQLVNYLSGGSGGNTPAAHFYLERVVPEVLPNSWILIERAGATSVVRVGRAEEAALADFSLSGRATGVQVENVDGSDVTAAELSAFRVRATTFHAGSRPLALAALPVEEPIGRDTAEAAQLTLNGLSLGLEAGRPIAITGERADLPGVLASEVVLLSEVIHSAGFTTLFFQSEMVHTYVRATVTLNANTVAATHGESVTEVLGNGNAAVPNQLFTLRKPPLTHVSDDSPAGARSTLSVRVNDVDWEQHATLYSLGRDDTACTVRLADDATAHVIFGDGQQGARLPTGNANVVANYRSGIGLAGQVAEGSLSILQTRPLGIREVINPVPATGAEDPETLDRARGNAPLTVRTLERVVSLQDHADFARAFAGVGKADAAALWNGRARFVNVTIASASGDAVPESSTLHINLVSALAAARAPLEPFRVTSFQPLYFNLEAKVLVASSHDAALVLSAVQDALREAFGFARRGFGQSVSAAEVVTVIHSVPGVMATDIDALFLVTESGGTGSLAAVLPALPARWNGTDIDATQLLLINPVGITLTEMTP
jgi:predicted phage baseplate assembly protein